jgi:hypothetical protein
MPLIVDKFNKLHRLVSHHREADFQSCVAVVANQMFGSSAVYVDVKQGLTSNDIVTIPSGYIIDITEASVPRLFIVKAVIARHFPFWNTGVELFKFVTSFDGAQGAIRAFLHEQIAHDTEALTRLEEARKAGQGGDVNAYLDTAVNGNFRGLVVIDDARDELNQVLEKINADISVLELKTYEAEDGSRLYQIDTLYGEDEAHDLELIGGIGERARMARRQRLADIDTIIVPTRDETFKRLFVSEGQWFPVRIAPALKQRIRFIAAYRPAPVNAVTHLAEVRQLKLHDHVGDYTIIFKGPAQEIRRVPLRDMERTPTGPLFVRKDDLLRADTLEAAFRRQGD